MTQEEAAAACDAAMDQLVAAIRAYLDARDNTQNAHVDVRNWAVWRLSVVCSAMPAPGYPHKPLAQL